jgi:hypothetical protein
MTFSVPHNITPGLAEAAKINDNFDAVERQFNSIDLMATSGQSSMLNLLRVLSLQDDLFADFKHANSYGQSTCKGNSSLPALSTSQIYGNVMFLTGVRNNYGTTAGNARVAIAPLVEDNAVNVANEGESPVTAMTNRMSKFAKDNGILLKPLWGSVTGEGGTRLDQLAKVGGDGTYTNQLMREVNAVKTYADANNKSYAYLYTAMTHGESDSLVGTLEAAYKSRLVQLDADIAADTMAVTGQSWRPISIWSQCSTLLRYPARAGVAVPLGQLRASQENEHIYLACPNYILERSGDSTVPGAPSDPDDFVHFSAEGSRKLGHYFGIVAWYIIYLGIDWKPLHIESAEFFPNRTEVTMHIPYGDTLTFDTTQVLAVANYGFGVVDASGNVQNVINGTPTISGRVITIPQSSPVPIGGKITLGHGHGLTGNKDGPKFGPRTNIRDTQGDVYNYINANAQVERLDNWAVLDEFTNTGV